VRGLAVSVSRAGDTSTFVPASLAMWFSVAGKQAGDAPLGGMIVCAPERLPVPRTMATASQLEAATSRTM